MTNSEQVFKLRREIETMRHELHERQRTLSALLDNCDHVNENNRNTIKPTALFEDEYADYPTRTIGVCQICRKEFE